MMFKQCCQAVHYRSWRWKSGGYGGYWWLISFLTKLFKFILKFDVSDTLKNSKTFYVHCLSVNAISTMMGFMLSCALVLCH